MNRKRSGQEVMEFALIGGLVFCVALFTTIMFGKNIANFFEFNPASANAAGNSSKLFDQNSISNGIVTPDSPVNPADPTNTTTNYSDDTVALISNIANDLPDINTTIKTSGASGATDTITDKLDVLVAQLKTIADSTSDPAINDLYQKGLELANTGHIVADAQEWIEYSAIRTESEDAIDVPSNNQVCQYGELKSTTPSCDQSIDMENMLTEGFHVIGANLTTWNDKFNQINNDLQISGYDQTGDVKLIIDLINELALEIDEISNNVYDQAQLNSNIDDLLNGVASSTTDINSDLIQTANDLLATQETNPL